MKKVAFYLMLCLFALLMIKPAESTTAAPPVLIYEPCPVPPGGDQFTVFQDLNGDGIYDWETHVDCYGCCTQGPIGGQLQELGVVGQASSRPNETRSFTVFTTPAGNEAWQVRSYNAATQQTYYTLTSSLGVGVLEIAPPPPSSIDESPIGKGTNTGNPNLKYFGQVQNYEKQAYEFKSSSDGLSWTMRVYNKETGETYYTIASNNGKGEIIYPKKDDVLNINSDNSSDDLVLKIYPNPTKSILNIDYNSDTHTKIEVMIFDISGRQIGQTLCYEVEKGQNSLKMSLKDMQSGVYILQVNNGNKIIKRSILIGD
ncbi:MAG: T9SS type A sorting domain-containing protein [Candidatus Kapaibacterium sp.]|jgi:hypothetical protein|nr:T9SS type A sorting domain-containing protein [Candidatus Kapabacteria bacterium]